MESLRDRIAPVTVIVIAILAVWYVFAVLLNAPFQRDMNERAGSTPQPTISAPVAAAPPSSKVRRLTP